MYHKSLLLALSSIILGQILADPIDYDGTSQVTLDTDGDWSAKFGVGSNCDGDSTIELTIDITATSTEADLILGFGTETNYFAVFNPYDGGMCVPCTGDKQTGTLFVTPPRGAALRSPDAGKTTTTQYGATDDTWGARVALVNSGDQTAQWDLILGASSDIGANTSPITLTIVQDIAAGTTTLTVNKNSITSTDIEFTSTFTSGGDLFLFLGIDDYGASTESFQLNGIQITQNQCNPAGPIDYDGESEVILDQKGEWSAIYGVGESCEGRGLIELSIDVTATSTEADLILGFGTEENYFVIFNSYDGGMCIPCAGNTQSGTLFVTPPNGEKLRTADTTTSEQFGATSDTTNRARAALINNQDINAQWDLVVGTNSDIGDNGSPILLTIATSIGKTTVTVTKNGITSDPVEFTSTFDENEELFLFLGIDDWNDESFTLNGITQQQNECEQCDACDNKDRLDDVEGRVVDLDESIGGVRTECNSKISTVNNKIIDLNDRIDSLINQLNSISAAHSSGFNQNNQIKDDGNATYLLSNTDILMVSLLILSIFIINIWICCRNGSFKSNKRSKHKYSKVDIASHSDVENLK